MKYVKMLGLAAVAATALMAFMAASASASVLCSTATTPCTSKWPTGTVLDFSLKSGGSAKLVTTDGKTTLDTCTGGGTTVSGKLESDTSTGTNAKGNVSALKWETCTFLTNTLKTGGLEVVKGTGGNGTVKSTGEFQVTINTGFFGSCIYGVGAGTTLGELKEGKPATFVANAVAVRFGTNFACPETAKWTGEYTLTTPANTTLYVSSL